MRELLGWRGWRISVDPAGEPYLGAHGDDTPLEFASWDVEAHARCRYSSEPDRCDRSGDGELPGEDCQCGVYAYPTRAQLINSGYRAPVHGQVLLTGKTVPQRSGRALRAARGRILPLFVETGGPAHSPRTVELAGRIAERLNVPLTAYDWRADKEALAVPPPMPLGVTIDHVLREVEANGDPTHDVRHARAVASIALDLIRENGAGDPVVAELFGILHDVHRGQRRHGEAAAAYARQLRGVGLLELDDDQMALLCTALEGHAHGTTTSDPTIGACWDADRLELRRVGARIASRLLSTDAGRKAAAVRAVRGTTST